MSRFGEDRTNTKKKFGTEIFWYSYKLKNFGFSKIFHVSVFYYQNGTQLSGFFQDQKNSLSRLFFDHHTTISGTSDTLNLITSSYSSVSSVSSLSLVSSLSSLSSVSSVWSTSQDRSRLINSLLKSDQFDHVYIQVRSPSIRCLLKSDHLWSGLHLCLINFDLVSTQVRSTLI